MKHQIYYDGTCPLCRKTRKKMMKLDWLAKIEWIDGFSKEHVELPAEVDRYKLNEAMHLVTNQGHVYIGFSAVRRMLWLLPAAWAFVWILYLPLAKKIGDKVYHWIAARRYKIGNGQCGGGSCNLP
ncbi:thiol-disulfide oxidoreductase DCC family protein [Evansella halocellulosilytica]|uniref:thiol-disulfide oxidoreductase DCC family protein n=1 Tax=Evansella halocellulosilytica TaxID=2011013 RepID=UPI0015CD96EA|nr:DUF393 domain-containing protein [Evansella halocellulosilytica]